jgi:hypothetical protein
MAHSTYKPKSALFAAFPEMQALSKEANDVMEGAEETLSEREFAGWRYELGKGAPIRGGMAH